MGALTVNRSRLVEFTLRDLRQAKCITQKQLARALEISKSMYSSIENGYRKPNIDITYKLALVYSTSMDFIYHAFYRQHFVWNYPDHDLKYAMREAKEIDIQYLQERYMPYPPEKMPEAVILERIPERDPDDLPIIYGKYSTIADQ